MKVGKTSIDGVGAWRRVGTGIPGGQVAFVQSQCEKHKPAIGLSDQKSAMTMWRNVEWPTVYLPFQIPYQHFFSLEAMPTPVYRAEQVQTVPMGNAPGTGRLHSGLGASCMADPSLQAG